jgi:hypothetical protein
MNERKVVIGMHGHAPAPMWTEPHDTPSPTLLGCVGRWTQLTRLTQYDKLPAFGLALEVLARWSEDIRSERAAMQALWQSPRLSQLNESTLKLGAARMEELQGQMRQPIGNGPPPLMAWNEGAWAPLPADLQRQLAAEDAALAAAPKS